MNHATTERIAKTIQRECGKELDALVGATGIARQAWVNMSILAVDRSGERQWEAHKDWLRTRAIDADDCAAGIEREREKARKRGFAAIPDPLDAAAKDLRKRSDWIKGVLRKNRRSDHSQTLDVLLGSVLRRKKTFNSWYPLTQVLARAFELAGLDSRHVTEDSLRKAAKRGTNGNGSGTSIG